MGNAKFLDFLGREIKVGDVIISSHREAKGGNSANLAIGVVTGFSDNDILVTKFQRGCWSLSGTWWHQRENGDTWRAIKGRCAYGNRCFITGMTEADLRRIVGIGDKQSE